LQYAGFTVTPILGSILAAYFQSSSSSSSPAIDNRFSLNKFTAPAYFLSLSCLVAILLLVFSFKNISSEHDIGCNNYKKKQRSGKTRSDSVVSFPVLSIFQLKTLFFFLSFSLSFFLFSANQ
jgi:hypothetical protein